VLNYQYRNRQRLGDYQASAELYRRVRPDLMISGHWMPRWVTDDYLGLVTEVGDDQVRIHRDLLPLDDLDIALDGGVARIAPYYSRVETGTTVRYRITVINPRRTVQKAELRLVLPVGWVAVPDVARISLPPLGREETEIEVTVGGPRRRARIAVDVSVGELHLGQHAEAVVDVTETT
jgi:hypothetical protein